MFAIDYGRVNSAAYRVTTGKPQSFKYGGRLSSNVRARSAFAAELVTALGLESVSVQDHPRTTSLHAHLKRVALTSRRPIVVQQKPVGMRIGQIGRYVRAIKMYVRHLSIRCEMLLHAVDVYEIRHAIGDFFYSPQKPRFSVPPSTRKPILRLVPASGIISFPRFSFTTAITVRKSLLIAAGTSMLTLAIAAVFLHERSELVEARASMLAARELSSRQAQQLAMLQYEARTLNISVAKLEAHDRELRSLVVKQDGDDAGGDAPVGKLGSAQQAHHDAVSGAAAATPVVRPAFGMFASFKQASQALSQMAARVLHVARSEHSVGDAMVAAIPSLDPTGQGEITSPFGYRSYPSPEYHRGIDLAIAEGHPVQAGAEGRVILAGWDGGFGNKIEIDHGNGYQTWYAHLSRIDVSVGESVTKGELIGAVGETGYATGPHLHYQIMLHGVAIDPAPYLHGLPPALAQAIKTR